MTAPHHIVKLADSPRLYQIDGFADEAEIAHILAVAAEDRLAERGIAIRQDAAGASCELPLAGDAVLEELRQRIDDCVGLTNDYGPTLRFRRYAPGESHPPHRDVYRIGDHLLVATAILYLCDTPEGGETFFPRAAPRPLSLAPRKGRLVFWFNYTASGEEDFAAEHEALAVIRGEKASVAAFIYRPAGDAAGAVAPGRRLRRRRRADGLRFHCVDDGVPERTTSLLRSACAREGIEYVAVEAREFDYTLARRLGKGDLLYRPAVSLAAVRVEQFLHGPDVATFYRTEEAALHECLTPSLVFARAGLPVPESIPLGTADRDLLRRAVEALGGFPVVLKWPGRSRGIGVLRVDSFPALFSLADFAASGSAQPFLCRYVAEATHYRLVVVGQAIAAAYRNAQERDDFRSYGSDDPADYLLPVDPAMADIAIRAAQALNLETAGVDILRARDGALFLLEANFPCYFAQAQCVTGVDVAGAMIRHLRRKAGRA